MNRCRYAFVFAALILTFSTVWADEQKIAVTDLPAAVQQAVKNKFPEAKMKGAEKEVEDGKTIYEVGLVDGDRKVDVSVLADGSIIEIERELAVKELPEAVIKAIQAKYLDPQFKKTERVVKFEGGKEKPPVYEALLVSGKAKVEVVVAANGEIVKTEDKRNDKDDD